jgi:O-antigen/teichoic acid export membrane protein
MQTRVLDDFSSNYQSVGGIIEGLRQACLPYSALQNISRFGYASLFARLHSIEREANNVNLALRLDVLAVLAVFAFVGAILLGVF